mgnify:FL=1
MMVLLLTQLWFTCVLSKTYMEMVQDHLNDSDDHSLIDFIWDRRQGHADRSLGPVPFPVRVPFPVLVPFPVPRPNPALILALAPALAPALWLTRPTRCLLPQARDMDTAATLRGRRAEAIRGAAQLAGQPARLEARPERQHAADAVERVAQHGAAHIGGDRW